MVLIQHFLIIYSITSRVCTTLRGSSDDIGWLQCTPGMASVEDGTSRFLELLAGIRYHAKSISSYPTIVGPAPERGRERTSVGYDSSMHFISGILLITMDLIDIFLVNLFVFVDWRCASRVGFFQYIRHLKNFFLRLKWIKPC